MRVACTYKTICNRKLCFLLFTFYFLLLGSCSIQRKIERSAESTVLSTPALKAAHVGISIFDPATNSYWYNYQGDKYFVPASNTKIPTCYAAMKYLGDSLVGARYMMRGNNLYIYGTGDPTFLHHDYPIQPVQDFIRTNNTMNIMLVRNCDSICTSDNMFERFGSGWAWSDYDADYMAERSFFPIYGNVVRFSLDNDGNLEVIPTYFKSFVTYVPDEKSTLAVSRSEYTNQFFAKGSKKGSSSVWVPFLTEILERYPLQRMSRQPDSLFSQIVGKPVQSGITGRQYLDTGWLEKNYYGIIRTQLLDSMLKPMMHRSDNFFAEQSLLMISNERFGFMIDRKIIDTLLKTDFKDLPQKPRWADGSGLSRYNLFTPQDFVAILQKNEE